MICTFLPKEVEVIVCNYQVNAWRPDFLDIAPPTPLAECSRRCKLDPKT